MLQKQTSVHIRCATETCRSSLGSVQPWQIWRGAEVSSTGQGTLLARPQILFIYCIGELGI